MGTAEPDRFDEPGKSGQRRAGRPLTCPSFRQNPAVLLKPPAWCSQSGLISLCRVTATRIHEEFHLTLTENAVLVIRDLTAQQAAPEGAGLRIATDLAAGSLTLALAEQPVQGDQVVDESGARIFLDADAAQLLDDKALDAAVDAEGTVQFGFAENPRPV